MKPHRTVAQLNRIAVVRGALEKSGCKCEVPSATAESEGVHIVAAPANGGPPLNVHVRNRPHFIKKYCGKNMHIAFPEQEARGVLARMYHLDDMLKEIVRQEQVGRKIIMRTVSWEQDGLYHMKRAPGWMLKSPVLRSLPCHPTELTRT